MQNMEREYISGQSVIGKFDLTSRFSAIKRSGKSGVAVGLRGAKRNRRLLVRTAVLFSEPLPNPDEKVS